MTYARVEVGDVAVEVEDERADSSVSVVYAMLDELDERGLLE